MDWKMFWLAPHLSLIHIFCVGGQLLLLDLIERLEDHCEIIQSNTDGILGKLRRYEDFEMLDDLCWEWEQRTGMRLEFDEVQKVYQKDVNNYIIVPSGPLRDEKGKPRWKFKGAYVKKLSDLDYDLPIVNRAIVNYFLHGISPETTIMECSDLRDFQKVVKVSSKYKYALYSPVITEAKIRDEKGRSKKITRFSGGEVQTDKTFRVFASKDQSKGGIFKVSGLSLIHISMAGEKNFENRLKDWLESEGIYPLGHPEDKMTVPPCGFYEKRWGGSRYVKSGLPDMRITVKGIALEVELKATNGTPSELQKRNLKQINGSNGFGFILYPEGFETFKKIVKGVKQCEFPTACLLYTSFWPRSWNHPWPSSRNQHECLYQLPHTVPFLRWQR